jgi:hypothetical protein
MQRAFFPLQLISKAERQLEAKQGSPQASKSEKESRRMRKVLEKVRSGGGCLIYQNGSLPACLPGPLTAL